MREKKAELASFVLIGVMLASIFAGAVSGAGVGVGGAEEIDVCVIPTDDLYINEDTTLCPGTYDIPDAGAIGVIIINADDVVLDCNGATIRGTGSGDGIYNYGFDNVTIMNCNVMNYRRGIHVRTYADHNIITNNTVSSNTIAGISLYGAAKYNTITYNTANSNNRYGIYLAFRADNNTVVSNIANSNKIEGIRLEYSSNNMLSNNTANSNSCGISMSWNSRNCMLTNNTANSNNYHGILIRSSFNNIISSNKANYNQKGLYFTADSEDNVVNHNIFCDNSVYDIDDRGENTGDENTCDRPGGWNDAGTTGCTNVCPNGEMPDLIVTLNGPEKVIAGEDVALEVIVSNIGSATAPGSIDVEYRKAYHVDLILSSDSDIPLKSAVRPAYAEDFVEDMLLEGGRISRTVSIPPGGYANYTLNLYIPKNASPGIYCLGAVVDPAKAVDELNEDNNTYCHKINILPPEMAPTEPPAGVDFYVMPYAVGGTPLYNINDSGLTDYADIVDAPFGSRLGFRHVYDSRIPTEEIMYYRWLYKDESETEWHEFTETVVVHYEKKELGVLTFPVYTLGPKGVNGMNLYEFKPDSPPEPGTSWPATDGFGDIYSGFLNSEAISDGKYKIKLEIYDKKGNQVIPANSTFKFIVPTGVDANGTIHTRNATSGEIDNGGFVFSLHIDNRKCSAVIDAPSIGTTSMADECGFLRYTPADETVHIAFHATHPDNFAIFTFSIIRGTKTIISANGEVSAYSVGDFSGDGNGNFENESLRTKLLEECPEAAFSENLYVYAKATTGWGHRIYGYDAHAVRAFALSPI